MDKNLFQLLKWFYNQCDGDWEHCYGIQITSLDNPGWNVIINLSETNLQNKPFSEIALERTEKDWVFCIVKEDSFYGNCGIFNLPEVLQIFADWAEIKIESNDSNTVDTI